MDDSMHFSDKEITSLITRFERRILPKKEWTHTAHLIVAVWYCYTNNVDNALSIVREKIIGHNESVGTPNTDDEGYHETITKFWLIMSKLFLQQESFKEGEIVKACNSFINLDYIDSSYPLNFYSTDLLFSIKARHNWVEPDLNELPTI